MSCHHIEPRIVDMARGVTTDQDAALTRHVLWCPSCAGLLERERTMSAALQRLAHDLQDPVEDSRRMDALLAMFDRPEARRRHRVLPGRWAGLAAAGVVLAAAIGWHVREAPADPGARPASVVVAEPETAAVRPLESDSYVQAESGVASTVVRSRGARNADLRFDTPTDAPEFVAWPGAAAWPPFESGELIRIDIPTDAGVVQADVLIDQDGFARAIRLVQ
jgi:hypothetical protein